MANAGNGSIVIKGKTGLPWPNCCVVIASVKVTLVKEVGIEIGDIVAPDANAETGQAADAKATYEALLSIRQLLAGKSYDLSDAADVPRALGDIITALGGTVANI